MTRITIRAKLLAHSALLVLGSVAGVGLSMYLAERYHLLQRAELTHAENTATLAGIAADSIKGNNIQLLESYMVLLRRSRLMNLSLSYAMVQDLRGVVLAHTQPEVVNQALADRVTRQALEIRQGTLRQEDRRADDVVIDLAAPVVIEPGRAPLAVARVGYSERGLKIIVDDALAATRRRVVLGAAIALLAGGAVAVFLAFLLSRPIRALRDGAHRMGEGNLEHRIPVTTRDELGELAQEFNLMAAKLHELDQLKQDFVSNVTHELRSPLTSLRGYVDFLLRGSAGPLNEEQRDFLIVVKNNAMRLARFIDNLLDVAKIEAGKIELHPEPVRLQEAAREMEVIFRPAAEEKSILFEARIPEDLPPLLVDADKLHEVLSNLLSNAFKFTPAGGRVTLSAEAEGGSVHLRVTDTGVGIPGGSLESVFNKFEQVKPTRGLARKTKGTGLGLTIVRGFVEAHGGRVWMESGEGRGTSANVVLPAAVAQEAV